MNTAPFQLLLAAPATPPREFRLLAEGTNETSKGPIRMSAAAGAHVLRAFSELGRDRLPFDYGHAQLGFVQGYDAARAAGWFVPQVRGGELWAADIQWTPTAARALSEREFRFFSPALTLDAESREVRSLINVALTNLPATRGQAPIMASAVDATPATPESPAILLADALIIANLLGESAPAALAAAPDELVSRFMADLKAGQAHTLRWLLGE
jgi:phage I-like protein